MVPSRLRRLDVNTTSLDEVRSRLDDPRSDSGRFTVAHPGRRAEDWDPRRESWGHIEAPGQGPDLGFPLLRGLVHVQARHDHGDPPTAVATRSDTMAVATRTHRRVALRVMTAWIELLDEFESGGPLLREVVRGSLEALWAHPNLRRMADALVVAGVHLRG